MRCATCKRLMSSYLDGELGRWRRRGLEHHLGSCLACQAELEAERRVWVLLGAAEVAVAPDVIGQLEARLERDPVVIAGWRWWRLAPVAYAAAIVLFAAAGSVGGVYLAARSRPVLDASAAGSEYAELLDEVPPGLAPVASMLQPPRTR